MTATFRFRSLFLAIALALALIATGFPTGLTVARAATPVFINEIHYDNDGTDTGEFIEIAAPAGTDLSGWSVVLYNGTDSQRSPYDTRELSGTVADAGGGYGFTVLDYPSNGIQNGAPDGVALVDGSTVVQFLSYEGTFTAASGPAEGMNSTDIGVAESSATPVGSSLQLGGAGTMDSDFTWQAPQPATSGAANSGQAFGGGTGDAPIVLDCGDLDVVEGNAADTVISATDGDETVTDLAVTTVDPGTAGITLDEVTPATAAGGTATATLSAADTLGAITYTVTITATNDAGDTMTCDVTVTVRGITPIGDVQGEITDDNTAANEHQSPLAGEEVIVRGVIYQRTLTDSGQRGFFLQNTDATDDDNPSTSDGIFVFTSRFEDLIGGYVPTVGDEVVISGRVSEFFGLTQLSSARLIEVVGSDVTVPAFTIAPPDDLEESYRYWERREGMRAEVPAGAVVQGGRDVFGGDDGELWAIPGDHPVAQRDEPYTNRVFRDPHPLDNNSDQLFDDGNGYRFLMGSSGIKFTEGDPAALIAPGRTFDTITNSPTGGVFFSFGKYIVQVSEQPDLVSGLDPDENAPPAEPDTDTEFSIATANVENLYDRRDDPFDTEDGLDENYVPVSQELYEALLDGLASQIATDLHAPDIVMVQEAEDQDICTVTERALTCGNTDNADGKPDTLQELALVIAEDFGVSYDAAYDRDGADDRGIVSAHLYRTDRVELVPVDADAAVLGAESGVEYQAAELDFNSDVQNPKALNADLPDSVLQAAQDNSAGYFGTDGSDVFTRAPQVAKFRVWRDGIGTSAYTDVWAVSNHFSSGPDRRVPQRTEQAAYNAAIVDAIEAADPNANVVVGGDFNVFPRPDDPYGRGNPFEDGVTDQLGPLYEQGLANLWDEVLADVPEAAYSYVFEGQAQTLDSLFVNDELAAQFVEARFAHINADWPADFEGDGARGVSDHDPMVARFLFVAGIDDVIERLDDAVVAGRIDERRARALQTRLGKANRFFERGNAAGACGQLRAFERTLAAWTPRFVDADTSSVLTDTAALLSAQRCR